MAPPVPSPVNALRLLPTRAQPERRGADLVVGNLRALMLAQEALLGGALGVLSRQLESMECLAVQTLLACTDIAGQPDSARRLERGLAAWLDLVGTLVAAGSAVDELCTRTAVTAGGILADRARTALDETWTARTPADARVSPGAG